MKRHPWCTDSKVAWIGCTALCLLAPLLVALDANAQAVTPRPTVTRALDIFESNPGRIIAGSLLVFKAKASPDAQRIVRSGLQVRVFALRGDEVRPRPITTTGYCDTFITVVLKVDGRNGKDAIVQRLDYKWLNLTDSLSAIVPGRYFLVFEQSGPDAQYFRLKTSDYAAYFATGFELTVDTNEGVSVEAVRAAYFERRVQLARLRLDIDEGTSAVPCYTYRRLSADTGSDAHTFDNTFAYCETQARAEVGVSDGLERPGIVRLMLP